MITFYEMAGCGFCVKSKQALSHEIEVGLIQVKPASESGGKFNGFPAFEHTATGKTHLGAVSSYQELIKKLDITNEHSTPTYQHADHAVYAPHAAPQCGRPAHAADADHAVYAPHAAPQCGRPAHAADADHAVYAPHADWGIGVL